MSLAELLKTLCWPQQAAAPGERCEALGTTDTHTTQKACFERLCAKNLFYPFQVRKFSISLSGVLSLD